MAREPPQQGDKPSRWSWVEAHSCVRKGCWSPCQKNTADRSASTDAYAARSWRAVHACSLQPAGESHPRGELARSLKGAGKKKMQFVLTVRSRVAGGPSWLEMDRSVRRDAAWPFRPCSAPSVLVGSGLFSYYDQRRDSPGHAGAGPRAGSAECAPVMRAWHLA
jgi:hypothetical protein